jgi:predicted P-loop ATPase/GTPase
MKNTRAGDVAWWYSTCLAYTSSCMWSLAPQKKKKTNKAVSVQVEESWEVNVEELLRALKPSRDWEDSLTITEKRQGKRKIASKYMETCETNW